MFLTFSRKFVLEIECLLILAPYPVIRNYSACKPQNLHCMRKEINNSFTQISSSYAINHSTTQELYLFVTKPVVSERVDKILSPFDTVRQIRSVSQLRDLSSQVLFNSVLPWTLISRQAPSLPSRYFSQKITFVSFPLCVRYMCYCLIILYFIT
jgi:hypothetical protein